MGKRLRAFAPGRRLVLGSTSRFNRPQSADAERRLVLGSTSRFSPLSRRTPNVTARSAAQAGSTGLSRRTPNVASCSAAQAGSTPSVGFADSSPRGGAGQRVRTEGGERVCAFAPERRLVLGSTSRFNRPQSASPARFRARRGTTAPPEGERVSAERTEGGERLCAVDDSASDRARRSLPCDARSFSATEESVAERDSGRVGPVVYFAARSNRLSTSFASSSVRFSGNRSRTDFGPQGSTMSRWS